MHPSVTEFLEHVWTSPAVNQRMSLKQLNDAIYDLHTPPPPKGISEKWEIREERRCGRRHPGSRGVQERTVLGRMDSQQEKCARVIESFARSRMETIGIDCQVGRPQQSNAHRSQEGEPSCVQSGFQ